LKYGAIPKHDKYIENIIQVSMDGPNVNWSFFEKLQVKIEKDFSNKLIDVGSCGLHILHNAFKAGISETKWDIGYRSGFFTFLASTASTKE
jgi:hypothetical protein